MTDKEQALVAAAYRVAAKLCWDTRTISFMPDRMIKEKDSELVLRSSLHTTARNIENLTPSDAETKLRELMMEVAWAVLGKCILEGTENFYGAEKIVDEVLNGLS